MNTIEEVCDKLKAHLDKWYQENKATAKNYHPLNGLQLKLVRDEFMKANPDYQKYDFNIHTGFDVDGNTWRPPCLDGCCICRATVRGVYAEPVNWDYTRNLAFKESKVLKQIAETARLLGFLYYDITLEY